METQESTIEVTPPRLIKALTEGFNTTANHIYLILLPVILDIFIWLGPRLRLESILTPIVENLGSSLAVANTTDETAALVKAAQDSWQLLAEGFNLTGSLSTFPIGIPSLMKRIATNESPFGIPMIVEMPSLSVSFFTFLLFAIFGIFLGGLYLSSISRQTETEKKEFDLSHLAWQILNGFALTLILILVIIIVMVPTLFITSIAALFSPIVSQMAVIAISFLLMWMLIPLLFSPHGIFAYQLNALRAILTSIRVVRAFLPGVGIFLLTAILLGQGLDMLWQAAPGSSWLTLVGIIGHAFIYTALLAASFVYYRQGLAWIQNNISQFKKSIKL